MNHLGQVRKLISFVDWGINNLKKSTDFKLWLNTVKEEYKEGNYTEMEMSMSDRINGQLANLSYHVKQQAKEELGVEFSLDGYKHIDYEFDLKSGGNYYTILSSNVTSEGFEIHIKKKK